MGHVVFVTWGTGGDVYPFVRIGAALVARGHRVAMLTNHVYEERVRRDGMGFVALDTADEFRRYMEDFSTAPADLRGFSEFVYKNVLAQAPREYAAACEMCEPGETVLVTRHLGGVAAQMAAEKLGCPLVSAYASPDTPLSITEELCRHVLGPEINRIRGDAGLEPVRDWRAWLRASVRVLALWPEWFSPMKSSWPAGVVPVGFVSGETVGDLPPPVREMIAGRRRPVLIAHGTTPTAHARPLEVSAEACRLAERPAILVTRYEEQVPRPLPDGVCWFDHLPFTTLMPHVAAVIHHGGMGMVSEAFNSGAAQLILPDIGERRVNADLVERLGAGLVLSPPRWRPDAAADALTRVTSSDMRERCRQLAHRMHSEDPVRVACEVIEQVIAGEVQVPEPEAPNPVASADSPASRLSAKKRALVALRLKQRGRQL